MVRFITSALLLTGVQMVTAQQNETGEPQDRQQPVITVAEVEKNEQAVINARTKSTDTAANEKDKDKNTIAREAASPPTGNASKKPEKQ